MTCVLLSLGGKTPHSWNFLVWENHQVKAEKPCPVESLPMAIGHSLLHQGQGGQQFAGEASGSRKGWWVCPVSGPVCWQGGAQGCQRTLDGAFCFPGLSCLQKCWSGPRPLSRGFLMVWLCFYNPHQLGLVPLHPRRKGKERMRQANVLPDRLLLSSRGQAPGCLLASWTATIHTARQLLKPER